MQCIFPRGRKAIHGSRPSSHQLPAALPFGRHTSLSAPAPPSQTAHAAVSTDAMWHILGKDILTCIVQVILTVCAHCTRRTLSWINYPIITDISRTVTFYHSFLCFNFVLYSLQLVELFAQNPEGCSSHFAQYRYTWISTCSRKAKTYLFFACLFLLLLQMRALI